MTLAQAPTAQGGTLPPEIAQSVDRLNGVLVDISRHIVGNEAMIRATGVALVSGANIFFQGLPGISKTMLAKLLAQRMQGKFHRKLYSPYLDPAAVFGVEDVNSYKEGRYERARAGSILEANIHFADELFRASDGIKDMMLGLFDERPTYEENGKTEYLDDLLLIIAASNTLPGPEDAAIGDRLVIQMPIGKLPEREDRKEIIVRHGRTRTGALPEEAQALVSVEEIKQLRQWAAANVVVPDGIVEKLVTLDDEMTSKLGLYVSPRTMNRCYDILQAQALLSGRAVVTQKDFGILAYVVAPIPSQDRARGLILDLTAPLEKEADEDYHAMGKAIGEWKALAKSKDKRQRTQAKNSGTDTLQTIANCQARLEVLAERAEAEGYDAEAIASMVEQTKDMWKEVSQMIRALYRDLAESN